MISPTVVSIASYFCYIIINYFPGSFNLLPIVPLPRYTCTRAVQQKRQENGQETRTNRTMVLAQRVNAFTTRTESAEGKKKSEFLHASFEIAAPAIVPCGSYATGLLPSPILSFLLSFFFFSSLVFLSLSVPHRRISFALFFPRIFPSHHLVSNAREHCRPLSLLFAVPFSYLFWRTSSVYAEGGFLLHRHQQLSKLKDSRRPHIFSHICLLPLSFPISFPATLPFRFPTLSSPRLRFLPSGRTVFLAALYLSQLILSGFFVLINFEKKKKEKSRIRIF